MKSLIRNFKTSNRGDKEMLIFTLFLSISFLAFIIYGLSLSVIRLLTTPIL